VDAQEVWQENKRWILGVAIGVVVFWIGSSVIGGMYSTSAASRKIRQARKKISGQELYPRQALAAARAQRDALDGELAGLETALLFRPLDEFVLDGKGEPDLHFDQVSRRVKRDLVRRAGSLGVELAEKNLEWVSPVGDDIQPTLAALCVLEQIALRLMDAHERARAWDPDALGLVAIDSLRVASSGLAGKRSARRSSRSRTEDLLHEDSVRFKFRADEATAKLFLEQCAAVSPPLTLAPDFKLTLGRSPGAPLVATGTLMGISLP